MAEFVLLDEVEKEIEKNRYLIMRNSDCGWYYGLIDNDIYKTIESCKQYEFEEPCTAEWKKVANNIEMEQVTRVGLRLKCSKCGNVVFATKNKGGYEIDNYCSHCGVRMLEKVGEEND